MIYKGLCQSGIIGYPGNIISLLDFFVELKTVCNDHQSYRECDDQFMKDYVSTFDPPITPVWLTDDVSNVTTHAVMKSFGKLNMAHIFFL